MPFIRNRLGTGVTLLFRQEPCPFVKGHLFGDVFGNPKLVTSFVDPPKTFDVIGAIQWIYRDLRSQEQAIVRVASAIRNDPQWNKRAFSTNDRKVVEQWCDHPLTNGDEVRVLVDLAGV